MSSKVTPLVITVPILLAVSSAVYADETKIFEHSGFDRIEAHEGINVSVSQGSGFSVHAVASNPKHLDRLKIRQRGDRLIIEQSTDWSIFGLLSWASNWNNEVQVDVTMPQLVEAEANSGADLRISGFAESHITLGATSGSDLIATDIEANKLSLEASSGANLTVSGACKSVDAEASSGSDIWAMDMTCVSGKVEVNSGADVDVTITSNIKAEAVAGGTANIHGNPERTDLEAVAGGSINISR